MPGVFKDLPEIIDPVINRAGEERNHTQTDHLLCT